MAVFSAQEYGERLRKTRERMHEQGVEVLLVSHPANMNYLTGFEGGPFTSTRASSSPGPRPNPSGSAASRTANAARILTSLREEDILGYPDHYVMSKLRHPMDFVGTS